MMFLIEIKNNHKNNASKRDLRAVGNLLNKHLKIIEQLHPYPQTRIVWETTKIRCN